MMTGFYIFGIAGRGLHGGGVEATPESAGTVAPAAPAQQQQAPRVIDFNQRIKNTTAAPTKKTPSKSKAKATAAGKSRVPKKLSASVAAAVGAAAAAGGLTTATSASPPGSPTPTAAAPGDSAPVVKPIKPSFAAAVPKATAAAAPSGLQGADAVHRNSWLGRRLKRSRAL